MKKKENNVYPVFSMLLILKAALSLINVMIGVALRQKALLSTLSGIWVTLKCNAFLDF